MGEAYNNLAPPVNTTSCSHKQQPQPQQQPQPHINKLMKDHTHVLYKTPNHNNHQRRRTNHPSSRAHNPAITAMPTSTEKSTQHDTATKASRFTAHKWATTKQVNGDNKEAAPTTVGKHSNASRSREPRTGNERRKEGTTSSEHNKTYQWAMQTCHGEKQQHGPRTAPPQK